LFRFDSPTNQWINEIIATTSLCRASVDIIVLDDYLIDVGEQDKISYLNILEK